MATRKKTLPVETTPTELTKSKATLKLELEDRINKGKELLKRPINNDSEYLSQKDEYSKWSDYNYELLRQAFNKTDNEYAYSYNQVGQFSGIMVSSSIYERRNPQEDYAKLKQKISGKLDNLEKLFDKVELLKSSVVIPEYSKPVKTELDLQSVFIVHGHDELAKTELARFLEKLKLKAIILHEQASSGNTIIEKIEKHTNVGFGIVLYTPCDVGSKAGKENLLKSRARQNVVFEHGYLIGKIGRKNVCALVKGDIEIPNDISGVIYINMDNSWQWQIAKELRESGYEIDMNLI
ncbi:MAG: TIR domain-containing protein [Paludibacteraceae bacterium]